MIYMRNITITTAKSATYLENVGFYGKPHQWGGQVWLVCDSGYAASAGRCVREDLPDIQCTPSTAHPINILTGSKSFIAEDFASADGSIRLVRHFQSRPFGGLWANYYDDVRGLANWRFDFQYEIQISTTSSDQIVSLLTPDGNGYRFQKQTDGSLAPYRPYDRPLPQNEYQLDYLDTWPAYFWSFVDVKHNFRMTDPENNVWLFETFAEPWSGLFRVGRPTQMKAPSGLVLTFEYGSFGEVTQISDNRGKSIDVHWLIENGYPKHVSQVDLPNGDKLKYTYEAQNIQPFAWQRLKSAELVNSSNVVLEKSSYDYDDSDYPAFVTGVRDRNNTLRWSVIYDDHGLATSSYGPGNAFRDDVSYSAPGSTFSRTVTNALGKVAIYNFTRTNTSMYDVRAAGVVGQASANCPSSSTAVTYGTDNFIATTVDEEARTTGYVNDSLGRPTEIREAQGTAKERETSFTWHSTFDVPTQVTEPGVTTTVTYEAP